MADISYAARFTDFPKPCIHQRYAAWWVTRCGLCGHSICERSLSTRLACSTAPCGIFRNSWPRLLRDIGYQPGSCSSPGRIRSLCLIRRNTEARSIASGGIIESGKLMSMIACVGYPSWFGQKISRSPDQSSPPPLTQNTSTHPCASWAFSAPSPSAHYNAQLPWTQAHRSTWTVSRPTHKAHHKHTHCLALWSD